MWIDALQSRANYLPISNTMNTMFKFFDPGFTSFIKNKASFVGVAIVSIGSTVRSLPVTSTQ